MTLRARAPAARRARRRGAGWSTRRTGFRYFDARDLLGFVDGTANPTGAELPEAALIGADADPEFAGGSYVVVQKYLHDMAALGRAVDRGAGGDHGPHQDRQHRDRRRRRRRASRTSRWPRSTTTTAASWRSCATTCPSAARGPGSSAPTSSATRRRLWVIERMLAADVRRRAARRLRPPPGLLDRRSPGRRSSCRPRACSRRWPSRRRRRPRWRMPGTTAPRRRGAGGIPWHRLPARRRAVRSGEEPLHGQIQHVGAAACPVAGGDEVVADRQREGEHGAGLDVVRRRRRRCRSASAGSPCAGRRRGAGARRPPCRAAPSRGLRGRSAAARCENVSMPARRTLSRGSPPSRSTRSSTSSVLRRSHVSSISSRSARRSSKCQ